MVLTLVLTDRPAVCGFSWKACSFSVWISFLLSIFSLSTCSYLHALEVTSTTVHSGHPRLPRSRGITESANAQPGLLGRCRVSFLGASVTVFLSTAQHRTLCRVASAKGTLSNTLLTHQGTMRPTSPCLRPEQNPPSTRFSLGPVTASGPWNPGRTSAPCRGVILSNGVTNQRHENAGHVALDRQRTGRLFPARAEPRRQGAASSPGTSGHAPSWIGRGRAGVLRVGLRTPFVSP